MKGVVVVVVFILLVLVSPGNCLVRRDVGPILGGWEPIKDLKDPHVQEIAEFAVARHNAQPNATRLKLRSVVNGETQVVQGINYRLVLAAIPSGNYEAVVWEIDWLHFKNLTSFKLISKPFN